MFVLPEQFSNATKANVEAQLALLKSQLKQLRSDGSDNDISNSKTGGL